MKFFLKNFKNILISNYKSASKQNFLLNITFFKLSLSNGFWNLQNRTNTWPTCLKVNLKFTIKYMNKTNDLLKVVTYQGSWSLFEKLKIYIWQEEVIYLYVFDDLFELFCKIMMSTLDFFTLRCESVRTRVVSSTIANLRFPVYLTES